DFLLLAADDIHKGNHAGNDSSERGHPKGAAHAVDRVSEDIGAYSKYKRPSDTASGIEEQKLRPVIFVRSGKERRKNAQEGDEPAEKNNFRATPRKEILPELEPLLRQVNELAIAQKELRAPSPAHPKPDVVA